MAAIGFGYRAHVLLYGSQRTGHRGKSPLTPHLGFLDIQK